MSNIKSSQKPGNGKYKNIKIRNNISTALSKGKEILSHKGIIRVQIENSLINDYHSSK